MQLIHFYSREQVSRASQAARSEAALCLPTTSARSSRRAAAPAPPSSHHIRQRSSGGPGTGTRGRGHAHTLLTTTRGRAHCRAATFGTRATKFSGHASSRGEHSLSCQCTKGRTRRYFYPFPQFPSPCSPSLHKRGRDQAEGAHVSGACMTCSTLGRGRTCGEEKKTLPGSGGGKARRVTFTTSKPQHCGTWSVVKKPRPNPQLPTLLEVNNTPRGTSVPPAPGAAAAPRACQGLGQSPAKKRGCAGAAPAMELLCR